jgi:hypothetical protein
MAIYNRWGDELKIVVNCGEVRPKQLSGPVTLVKVRYGDGAEDRWQFADFLKADGGWQEIKSSVEALQVSAISAAAMKSAISQAL